MYCAKCGKKLEENSKFCSDCGTPTSAANLPKSRTRHPQIKRLPKVYYGLIQLCCGIVFISFFLPWIGSRYTAISGYEMLTSEISWQVILVLTPVIAVAGISFVLPYFYRDLGKLKTYYSIIEFMAFLPELAVIILILQIGLKNVFGNLDSFLEVLKFIGIGGWGTILGLVGINIFAKKMFDEGLVLIGAKSLDEVDEDGFFDHFEDDSIRT